MHSLRRAFRSSRIRLRKHGSHSIAPLIYLAAIAVALLVAFFPRRAEPAAEEANYSTLLAALDSGKVRRLEIVPGNRIVAELADTAAMPLEIEFPMGASDGLLKRAEEAGAEIVLKRPSDVSGYADLVLTILLLFLVAWLIRTMFRGPQDITMLAAPGTTTFADVAGAEEVVAEMREVVAFLKHPERFTALGARTPRGILLSGPPGTGKTLLARAVAGEAGVPFFAINASSVTGFVVGLGAFRIKTVFKKARRHGGVIFIDEIDAVGARRGRNSVHNEDDRTLNQLLVEMDGFDPRDGVVVIGATNRPDILDPALIRPGRFDRLITITSPTVKEREEILRLHVKKQAIPLAADIDLGVLARLLPGASGADLANLLNEAAIAAGRRAGTEVRWQDIETARDRLLLGNARPAVQIDKENWKLIAYHEAGHVIAGLLCCPEDDLHKVTIQARGRSLGVAHFSPKDDLAPHSRRYLEGQLIKLLAGRAAERLVAGEKGITSGAENDLQQANRIARKMVMQLGMGESGSLLVFDSQELPLSEEAQGRLEQEIEQLLARCMRSACDLLKEHRAGLDALAATLLEHETLDANQIRKILQETGTLSRSAPTPD